MTETTAQKQWYIVHTYSGFEERVRENLNQRIEALGMRGKFGEIKIPTETLIEMKGGKKREVQRKFFPGYILVEMDMADDAWHLVKNTPKVTGFLGADNKPMPISEAEAERIISQMKEAPDGPRQAVTFEVGEQVRVSDGPFASFNGTVEEVDDSRSRLKVAVSIFGRATPVELEFAQVEKL